ncbi:alanine aminotransferase [Salpingoeca rosetta]|uniref:Alanine aminotransferase n=1 Tax=Salpingoeca rosetta (strain ATCC 50818 / BSB-021) TaxID=946362 RepID=F2UF45_SALR5|nr:alanine aminotransferase [Salpingoeca rosetta]EGD75245.1 alanine aminotransferase [Salpingoeca rosetta]|eukprot:XP_004992298.1 alanine aminotransferase [Salpingoeca rosetta]
MTDPRPDAVLHPEGRINQFVIASHYAVRGTIYIEAQKRKASGKEVIFTNIGNPQSLGQKPITFPRQVISLVTCPQLLEHPDVGKLFPEDAIARAKKYLDNLPGGSGAYQDSRGNMYVRQEVADFIARRDGHPANPEHIFLSDGASPAIQRCLNMLIRDQKDGILLPTPQYPLYSASVALLGGVILGYGLQEEQGWSLSIDNLNEVVADAKERGLTVRALVVINPGNPTGQVLSRENMEEIARWAAVNRVVLLADEVYQTNVYGSRPFISFKKVVTEMGDEGKNVELISFHTVSKGVFGECGRRGGYLEATNIHPGALDQLYKVFSIGLSSNVDGQLMMGLMCNPPKPGDASYEQYEQECDAIFQSLKRRAEMISNAFNALPGVSCQNVEGALYAFPRVRLPEAAVKEAEKKDMGPDLFYCLELLHATGICAVPGSGFGQEEGTFHFRTTILPAEEQMPRVIDLFTSFHKDFLQRFGMPSKM